MFGPVVVATCALILGGCSVASTGAAGAPAGASAPLGFAGNEQPPGAARIVFPLSVVRTGGIAAFDDHLVLEADGRVHVDSRSVRGRVCSLDSAQRRLLALLAVSPLSEVTTRSATAAPRGGRQSADDEQSAPLVITVSDERSRTLDLDGASSAEVHALLNGLLGDVTLSTPTSTRCYPVSSAPSQAYPSTESVTPHG